MPIRSFCVFVSLFLYLTTYSSDSIPSGRKWITAGTVSALGVGSILVLSNTWYSGYEQTSFHVFNDNPEWLQMDKVGHLLTSYHIGQFGHHTFRWSGMKEKSSLWVGGMLGSAYLSMVEVLDGYSSAWGFSWGDFGSNLGGSMLYIGQEWGWKEQRITPKFSAHLTNYASYRPEVLGREPAERILKDYNGQTYWLSVNLRSFAKQCKIPNWLSFSVGYSAKGMVSGRPEHFQPFEREREFILSFDADLWRIKQIKSKFLRRCLQSFGFIKIPFPALILTKKGASFNPLYF